MRSSGDSSAPPIDAPDVLKLVAARTGHFRLESGHHSRLWLDLDPLFSSPLRVQPLVDVLAHALRSHDPEVVCGPLVGGAFLAQTLAASLGREFVFTERALPSERVGLYRAEYHLRAGLRDRVRGKRVAIVDDVISAGSAARGTHAELTRHGARTVAVGALLALGTTGSGYFAERGIPTAFASRLDYDLWTPEACPVCATEEPLEDSA